MFERRLKIFLAFLVAFTVVLVSRGFHVQVVHHQDWVKEAADTLRHKTLVDTTRGQLLDVRGRPLAVDSACIDACVDFHAIPKDPDEVWIHGIAMKRAKLRDDYARPKTITRKEILLEETDKVKSDIQAMWHELAIDASLTPDEMDDLREGIVERVAARRNEAWRRKSQALDAARKPLTTVPTSQPQSKESSDADTDANAEPWYRRWLDAEGDAVNTLDPADVKVAEQTEAHVIIRAVSTEVYNRLGKNQEHFPGLVLRPRMGRTYPWNEAACHVLGRLTHVSPADLAVDVHRDDPLVQYLPNDLVGRGGLEGLCEPLLRGKRGQIEHWTASPSADDTANDAADDRSPREQIEDAIPGRDVRTTIDIELERELQNAFKHVDVKRDKADPDIFADMHGAAVVLDVASGEVRAMVSAPTYDLNQFDELFPMLRSDDLNLPLLNRATQSNFETGSTIKPVVGIGAITQGVMGINDTIECTGFLVINGQHMRTGRCWVASKFFGKIPSVAHHPVPPEAPHPTGFLTFTDALERSCNIYFENMGDRLGLDGLSHWMDAFGLGRSTGIGIAERVGRLPDSVPADAAARVKLDAKWDGGIGQGYVAASPLQMANVAATIARDGIWMRPRLLDDSTARALRAASADHGSTQASTHWYDVPDRVDLHLSHDAVAAAQAGMIAVVNSPAGTGTTLKRLDLLLAGKTGTAQAAPFRVPEYDETGKKIMENGRVKLIPLKPSTPLDVNPRAPWYLGFGDKGDELKHSWYIGFAPAHHPKIAFAVLVEYGGSGGNAAGSIANHIIEACVEHGYVTLDHHETATNAN